MVRMITVKNYCGISIRDKRKKRIKHKLNNAGKFLLLSVKSFALTSTRGKLRPVSTQDNFPTGRNGSESFFCNSAPRAKLMS